MQVNTDLQYDNVVNECRQIFIKKNNRLRNFMAYISYHSYCWPDLYKSKTEKNIQKKGSQKKSDDIKEEFTGILNYEVIGLIQ